MKKKKKKRYLATNITTDIIGLFGRVMSSSFTHHPPHFSDQSIVVFANSAIDCIKSTF